MTATTRSEVWGGGSDAMNAFETLMWKSETASMLRSTCVAVEVLESVPDWDAFVAAHQHAIRVVPRLRHRVVDAPLGLAAPRWTEDPNFDLHFHLRRMRLPGGAAFADLMAAAEQIGMSAFDRARPLWESTLVEGLPEGRAAFVFKLHHAVSDGLSFMRMLAHLHVPVDGRHLPPHEPAPTIGVLGAIAADARDRVEAAPKHLRRVGSLTGNAIRTPLPALLGAVAYGSSMRRVFAPPQARPSPLLARRSASWRFGALDVDFDSLRRAAKAVGGSLNDAYIAALMGGYRRYHEAMGEPVGPIPVAIPISLRAAEEASGGNAIASARLAGPIDVADPAARMAMIGNQVRAARDEPAMNNLNMLGPALARLPAAALASVIGNMARANDLQASNVPGPRDEVGFAGVRVERMYPFGPLPGCPAMITMVTHGQMACVGVNYDAAAFVDGPLLMQALCAGFDEVLALDGPDFPPTIRR